MKNSVSEIKKLSSEELLSRTRGLVTEERRVTVALISHLEEIQTRKLYAEKGFSSMWDFCTRHLGMSEGGAQRRISAMRLAHDAPEAKAALESGHLSLGNAAKLHSFRQAQKKNGITPTDPGELIKQVESLSQRECEAKLYELSPDILPQERERVVSAKKDHELKLVISDEVFENLQRIKGHLAHAKPNASYGELLEYLINETLGRLEKKKGIVPADSTATVAVTEQAEPLPAGKRVYLPVALRRQVFARSEGRCEYAHEGRRCTSRYALELDHVTPLALGGSNEARNCRVLCKVHNLQQAIEKKVLDPSKIQKGKRYG